MGCRVTTSYILGPAPCQFLEGWEWAGAEPMSRPAP